MHPACCQHCPKWYQWQVKGAANMASWDACCTFHAAPLLAMLLGSSTRDREEKERQRQKDRHEYRRPKLGYSQEQRLRREGRGRGGEGWIWRREAKEARELVDSPNINPTVQVTGGCSMQMFFSTSCYFYVDLLTLLPTQNWQTI